MKCSRFVQAGAGVLLLLAGCSSGDDLPEIAVSPSQTDATAQAPASEPAGGDLAEAIDGTVSGEIVSVDAVLATFVVNDGDSEWEFRYSPDTEVTGGSGIQGLTSQTGSQVRVDYQGAEPASRRAVRIEIVEPEVNPSVP